MFIVEFFFGPDGIIPDSGLTGLNNTNIYIYNILYIYIYIYIYKINLNRELEIFY